MEDIISISVAVILSFITAKIAVRKEIDTIKEAKLRDRYWNYLKVLMSSKRKITLLERQTYNLYLFAKNKEIAEKAKRLLKQENLQDNDVDEMIKLMRKKFKIIGD